MTQNNWKNRIPGCFGTVDQIFAMHPLDEQRAKEMMKQALESGASIQDILNELEEHMKSKNCSEEHIQEQLINAKSLSIWE